ncbi:MAG: hypothetical protein GYB65_02100, partial [Chloroflexi bacterium]|nr:hypothetical protein [Chloroflexota bacterium]
MRLTVLRLTIILALVAALLPTLPLFAGGAHPAAAQDGCTSAPSPRLGPGQQGRVTISDGTGNNVRDEPSTTNPNNVNGVMYDGEVFTVTSGPYCYEDYWWYEVRRDNGDTGWTAEGANGQYWIEPWGSAPVAPAPAAPAPSTTASQGTGGNGEIAFYSGDAITMLPKATSADGNLVRDLGGIAGYDSILAWSPDSAMVAFSDGPNIYAVGQFDISNVTNAPAGQTNYYPTWAPDSSRMAFVTYRDGNAEIYSSLLNGTDVRRLTTDPGEDLHPNWSPDGLQIAFATNRSGNFDILLMSSSDGSSLVGVAQTPADELYPTWSPDGMLLAYLAEQADGTTMLYVIQPGMQPVAVAQGTISDFAWHPDSRRLAYIAETPAGSGVREVFTVNYDGTSGLQLTTSGGSKAGVSWSADGEWIAFSDGPIGNRDIYAIRADGSGLYNITNSPGVDDTFPVFQPTLDPNAVIAPPPSTDPPPSTAPSVYPGAEDLLLIYDPGVPVFTLKNTSGGVIDLTPLSFQGGGITVSSSRWTDY